MSSIASHKRLALKTPEASFLHVLQEEFNFSLRVSQELLSTAKEMLVGSTPNGTVRPGQVRLVVAHMNAPFGPPLAETDKVEVTLTVDQGEEDAVVKGRDGLAGQRRGRILRLTVEALEQGGVLTQEDLSRVLGVDARTIRRDVKQLKAEGHIIPTRGQVKGVGRGQTHKVQIIELWLDRVGYEQIARRMYHAPQSIKRYISTFLRMVVLYQKGLTVEEIAFLTKASVKLVQDYLGLYEAALNVAHRQEKLEEELKRVNSGQNTALATQKKRQVRQ